jgi:hypothetical protein
MSVWLDKIGRRPDGGHRLSGRTTVRPKFWEFRWKYFLFESRVQTVLPCRPDGRTFAASNFHIKASRVRTGRMVVRTADLMHTIFISDARASGPWWLVSGPLDLNCDICLMDECVRTGIHVVRTDASWSSSNLLYAEEVPDGNPRRPDGWCFSLMCVQTVWHVVWTVDVLDSWASGRMVGNRIFWLANYVESSGNTFE